VLVALERFQVGVAFVETFRASREITNPELEYLRNRELRKWKGEEGESETSVR
jgi:hypothetical protein